MQAKSEGLGADSPGNSRCTLLGWVRLEKQFNNKPYRSRNVQSWWVAAGWLLASPWGSELHPSVLHKGPGGDLGNCRILPGDRNGPAHSLSRRANARAHGCVPAAAAPPGSIAPQARLPPASMPSP